MAAAQTRTTWAPGVPLSATMVASRAVSPIADGDQRTPRRASGCLGHGEFFAQHHEIGFRLVRHAPIGGAYGGGRTEGMARRYRSGLASNPRDQAPAES